MLTAIFAVLMLLVFGELLWASVKLAWSVWKIVFSFVLFFKKGRNRPFCYLGIAIEGVFVINTNN